MSALPAQRVEMIPIDRITIVNPRIRNKRTFKEIVDNIAQVGLKKPRLRNPSKAPAVALSSVT